MSNTPARRRRAIQGAIAAVVIALGLGIFAPAASASKSQCGSGFFCIWSSTNYTGGITIFSPPAFVDTCYNFTSPYDNNADSAYNHTSITIVLHGGYNCHPLTTDLQDIGPGVSVSSFGFFNNYWSSLGR